MMRKRRRRYYRMKYRIFVVNYQMNLNMRFIQMKYDEKNNTKNMEYCWMIYFK